MPMRMLKSVAKPNHRDIRVGWFRNWNKYFEITLLVEMNAEEPKADSNPMFCFFILKISARALI